MKLPITIEYMNGESATYVAQVPEWARWERKTGNIISKAQEKIGIEDMLFLAYHAMRREGAGKAVKPYEVWCETVSEITAGDGDPKAISAEA